MLCGLQFHLRRDSCQCGMGPFMVIALHPLGGKFLCLFNALKAMLIRQKKTEQGGGLFRSVSAWGLRSGSGKQRFGEFAAHAANVGDGDFFGADRFAFGMV